MPYVENESYKHKFAKELLCSWLNEKIRTHWDGDGAILEYPLIKEMGSNGFIGFNNCTSDMTHKYFHYGEITDNKYNPTYDQCIANNDIPLAVLDIAMIYKGRIYEAYEVYHTHKVDHDKMEKIKKLTKGCNFKLYEVSAEDILRQTKKPEDITTICDLIYSREEPKLDMNKVMDLYYSVNQELKLRV